MANSAGKMRKNNAGDKNAASPHRLHNSESVSRVAGSKSQKTPLGDREVDPKLVKLMARIVCGLIVLFAIAMVVFVFYAQTQLTDDSSSELNGNYTYSN